MTGRDKTQDPRKSAAAARYERLEAELKRNLKKRKDKARAKTRAGDAPSALPAGDKPSE